MIRQAVSVNWGRVPTPHEAFRSRSSSSSSSSSSVEHVLLTRFRRAPEVSTTNRLGVGRYQGGAPPRRTDGTRTTWWTCCWRRRWWTCCWRRRSTPTPTRTMRSTSSVSRSWRHGSVVADGTVLALFPANIESEAEFVDPLCASQPSSALTWVAATSRSLRSCA